MGARCASFIPVGARRVCDLGSSRINAEERRPLGLVPTFTLIGHKIPDAAPSVPMKMRHGAAGNLDLRARKDDLAHAHAADT